MSDASINLQWKGTDACFDLFCPTEGCPGSHFDTRMPTAPFVRCICGQIYKLPHGIKVEPVSDEEFEASGWPEAELPIEEFE